MWFVSRFEFNFCVASKKNCKTNPKFTSKGPTTDFNPIMSWPQHRASSVMVTVSWFDFNFFVKHPKNCEKKLRSHPSVPQQIYIQVYPAWPKCRTSSVRIAVSIKPVSSFTISLERWSTSTTSTTTPSGVWPGGLLATALYINVWL